MNTKHKSTILSALMFALILAMSTVPVSAAVKLSKTKLTLTAGKTYTLKVTGTKEKIKWSTSNKKIATVTGNGKVKAIKKGSCYIYAKTKKKTFKCKITVNPKPVLKEKYTKGMYRAGKEIPTGQYVIYVGKDGFLNHFRDLGSGLGEWDLADGTNYNFIVTLKEGDKLNLVGTCYAVPSKYVSKISIDTVNKYSNGALRVGTDIQAGEYMLTTNDDFGYFYHYDKTGERFYDNSFETNYFITLKKGEVIYYNQATLGKA